MFDNLIILISSSVPPKILTDSTKSIFRKLLLRSGEPTQRIHDLAIDTGVRLVKSPKIEELDVLDALLTEKITSKEPPKVALSRVKFTQFLVQQYGIRSVQPPATNIGRFWV